MELERLGANKIGIELNQIRLSQPTTYSVARYGSEGSRPLEYYEHTKNDFQRNNNNDEYELDPKVFERIG